MNMRTALQRVLKNPLWAFGVFVALARGRYYILKFRLLGRRVSAGKRFRVVGRLDIRGPGTVIFGDYCGVISSFIQVTTVWTHSPEAVINIGDRTLITGARFGCANRIDVGEFVSLSDARIMDTDFHSIEASDGDHRAKTPGRSKPIRICSHSWLGAGSMVLKGVTIGENAVVGAGAVVATSVPAYAVVFGNPARIVWRTRPPQKPVAEVAAAATAAVITKSENFDDEPALR
jgi:acetyltransferase-like isoleucine patch superfamily enzyme